MKDIWFEQPEDIKKINKKKIIITIIFFIIIIAISIIIVIYHKNQEFHIWMDRNILRKEVMQDNVTTINLKEGESTNVYAFNKYIGILNKTNFSIYGNTGHEEKKLIIEISNPLFSSGNRFLAIAEKKGQKLYLIEDKDIAWEAKVEGNISQIHVNKNGYVAVVIVDTSYKSVIKMYTPEGKELFNTYLSATRAIDVSISNDNKYLAIAEVDTSGAIIQSNIKVISVEKASSDPTNSVEHTYQGEKNKLITNIKYQDKNKLVCMYTDGINIVENEQNSVLTNNKDKKVIFQSVDLSNYICSVEEKPSGLFTADSIVNIINMENKNTKEYKIDSVAKEIYTYGDIIAINLGTDVEIINTNGRLVKRYLGNQEITKLVVSNYMAGIIYRDKIEIINL